MAQKLGLLDALCLLILPAACNSPLKDERTLDLTEGEDKDIIIEAAKWKQKIKVAADAPDLLTVRIFLEKDKAAAESAIATMKDSDVILASEKNATQIRLEAAIPANEAVVIRVRTASQKATKATVKITS
jgi:hypothetical protein